MYDSFFGFSQRPFTAAPRIDRYFPAFAIETARQTLERSIDRAEGCGLVVGPAGTGKTLLCQVLAEQFRKRMDAVVLSGAMISSRKELLQAITYELKLPYKQLHEGELRLALIDRLGQPDERPEGMLLIVDEAHTLSLKLLEELRLLTNLVRSGSPRVRLVMAGAPVLEERFAIPRLASFNQRIVARCLLDSFSAEETREYIRAQTAGAGVDPNTIWSPEALGSVHQATDGCPRLINQLSDMALMLASVAQVSVVDEEIVNESWAELQQLPGAWNAQSNSSGVVDLPNQSAVVEFGSLEEEFQTDAVDENEGNILEAEAESVPNPLEPIEHLDRIQSHLANVAQSYLDEDSVETQTDPHIPLANGKNVEDLLFSTTGNDSGGWQSELPATPLAEQPVQDWPVVPFREAVEEHINLEFQHPAAQTPSSPPANPAAKIEIDDEVEHRPLAEYDSFAGLDGSTVVQLSPNPRPVSEDNPVVVKNAEATLRQQHNVLFGLEGTMNPQDDMAPTQAAVDPPSPNVGLHNPHMALHAQSPVDPRFVDMQFIENDGRVVEDKSYDPVAPMPSVVVEYSDEGSSDGDSASVDSAVGADRTLEFGSSIDVMDSTSELSAMSHKPILTDIDAGTTGDGEIRSPVKSHPTIPVGQRDYRQLFSKLRQQQNQR